MQSALGSLFVLLNIIALSVRGNNPFSYMAKYGGERGMSFSHDVHDWLGGYPYESASPEEIRSLFIAKGFVEERSFVERPGMGILGSGCDEFVFRKL